MLDHAVRWLVAKAIAPEDEFIDVFHCETVVVVILICVALPVAAGFSRFLRR